MADCVNTGSGWGALWGSGPWAGMGGFSPGGPLPAQDPFDIFCVCADGASYLPTYDGVTVNPPLQFVADIPTGDLIVTSNNSVAAIMEIAVAVPASFTYEAVIQFDDLPVNFSTVATERIFLTTMDNAGYAAGLFFSQIGIAYGGASNAPLQVIPNTAGLVQTGKYYVIRVAVSDVLGAVYIYFTELSIAQTNGQTLIAIMPLVPYASLPGSPLEGVHLEVAGIPARPSQIHLDFLCLATGVLIPNLQPIADAGPDQASRTCQIIQLDGNRSFDPENQPLLYYWKLIDAPITSSFNYTGTEGATYPLMVPTGFTNKFHSTSFGGISPIPLSPGDMLVVDGEAYEILTSGTDGNGDYVQVDGVVLPDNWSSKNFHVLLQAGMNTPNDVKSTFFPDVSGFYTFQLVVFDGSIYSEPSKMVVNVLETPLPRGCIPDLSFIWSYLSDFWGLVEDKERIPVVWGGAAQAAATELYTLWQHDYSKSLRDIQRTFIRRWLHLDLFQREPFPELCKTRLIFRGVDSSDLTTAGVVAAGQQLVLSVPYYASLVVCSVSGADPITPKNIAAQLHASLQLVDKRFKVTCIPLSGGNSRIRIYAPFPFTVVAGTTLPFVIGTINEPLVLQGGGVVAGTKTYKAPFSLLGIDIQSDDYLYINGTGVVRIASTADVATDTEPYQRLLLKEDISISAGATWGIAGRIVSTQLDFYTGLVEDEDYALFEISDAEDNSIHYYTCRVLGVGEGTKNALAIGPDEALVDYYTRPDRFSVEFWGVYRRKYCPIEEGITDIPYLQRQIKDVPEDALLRRNIDFYLEKFRGQNAIRFDTQIWQTVGDVPQLLTRLWAEYVYIDNESTIENNFGIPAELTLEQLRSTGSTADYLSAVRGLWYAYINGPTLYNLRVGTQILLGLPFAEEEGIIEELRTDYSPTQGRFLIRDTKAEEIVRSYTFPKALPVEVNPATGVAYVVGDTVKQFAPLIEGVEVVDWVKDPTWFEVYKNQGLLYEIEKFHKFLVRVDSDAFSLTALMFARSFLLKIKPTYTYPLFLVTADVSDLTNEISVTDELMYLGKLSLYDMSSAIALWVRPPAFGTALTDFVEGMVQTYGSATMSDEPDPSPGEKLVAGDTPPTPFVGELSSHWQNAADTSSDPTVSPPVYPTPTLETTFGADRPFMLPQAHMIGLQTDARYVAPALPTADSVFVADRPVWNGVDAPMTFGQQFLLHIPPGSTGALLMEYLFPTYGLTVNGVQIRIKGLPTTDSEVFIVEVFVNGVLEFQETFTHTLNSYEIFYTNLGAPYVPPICEAMTLGSFVIAANDEVQVRIRSDTGLLMRPFLNAITVILGECVAWTSGVNVPADTYYGVKLL